MKKPKWLTGLFDQQAKETDCPYKVEPGQGVVKAQAVVTEPKSWIDRKLDKVLGDAVNVFSIR